MLKILIWSFLVMKIEASFEKQENETIHHNVFVENDEPWNPEMYARKIILNNFTGSITPQTFSLVSDIEELYFAHSNIKFIHPEAFKLLSKLQIIQFSYNTNLPFLTNEIFKKNQNLTKIIIGHNQHVDGISETLFADLPSLTHIEVTKESKIPRRLTKDFFKNSKSLKSIKIHFSNITSVASGTLEELENLVFFSLAENDLKEIEPRAFSSNKLTYLYLLWNKLSSLSGAEFYQLKNLKKLDVSCNPLKEINVDKIRKNAPNLKLLSIAQTTLTCAEKKQLVKLGAKSFWVHIDQSEFQKCKT